MSEQNQATLSLEDLLAGLLVNTGGQDVEENLRFEYLDKRKIVIDQEITNAILLRVILPLREMDNDGTNEPIEIVLNTPGGDVTMSFALISEIEKLKTPTTIRIIGNALSGGCMIAMAYFNNPNVKTIASKYSVGLLHLGSYEPGMTNLNALKKEMKFNSHIEKMMLDYIVSHSRISLKKAKQILNTEYYMTGQEMFDLGIVSGLE